LLNSLLLEKYFSILIYHLFSIIGKPL